MLHIRVVEGPKKTGSMETRLEAMEQQVFKCQGMVERGLNANHMMITEFTNNHKMDAIDIGKHLSRLYDRVDQLQGQIYDLQNQNCEGPSYGYRGRVMLAFEENGSSKIGVRFDKQIPDGNDLGGLCEEDHGFFCSAELLRPDFSGSEEVERLAMTELIEIISEESNIGSLIVLLKDVEKSFTGITESFSSLRNKLELLPPGVLIIGSHTQMDSRKEKAHPGGFLFTKFASSSQTLFDLFPDSFGSRLHERSKESPKAMKHLNKLFPNKISIQLPQDEALLTSWKQHWIVMLKPSKQNLTSLAFVRAIECNDLEELFIKDQSLTNENVDKIVGYAVSYHLKHNNVETSKDGKLIITSGSLKHGLDMLQSIHSDNKSSKKSLKDVATENEFEKRLLADVIPPNDIGVTFDDIGALENVKETLKELVMLPLQRPELFCKGQLTKVALQLSL
ncbi:hypothetical protein D1007_06125 [Hordeum vulgare]|nr:hypothetical protein D1007_06125 [Hordeum vulgare]